MLGGFVIRQRLKTLLKVASANALPHYCCAPIMLRSAKDRIFCAEASGGGVLKDTGALLSPEAQSSDGWPGERGGYGATRDVTSLSPGVPTLHRSDGNRGLQNTPAGSGKDGGGDWAPFGGLRRDDVVMPLIAKAVFGIAVVAVGTSPVLDGRLERHELAGEALRISATENAAEELRDLRRARPSACRLGELVHAGWR